ncbi:MAG: hypothetical protein ACRCXT_17880 [Paraclostridium sp.]
MRPDDDALRSYITKSQQAVAGTGEKLYSDTELRNFALASKKLAKQGATYEKKMYGPNGEFLTDPKTGKLVTKTQKYQDISEFIPLDTKVKAELQRVLEYLTIPVKGSADVTDAMRQMETYIEKGGYIHQGFYERLRTMSDFFKPGYQMELVKMAQKMTNL